MGTTAWQQHAIVLDVATAAATISFGAGLSGEGELLVSKAAFEEVGSDVPVTAGPHRPRHPQSLDFSQTYRVLGVGLTVPLRLVLAMRWSGP